MIDIELVLEVGLGLMLLTESQAAMGDLGGFPKWLFVGLPSLVLVLVYAKWGTPGLVYVAIGGVGAVVTLAVLAWACMAAAQLRLEVALGMCVAIYVALLLLMELESDLTGEHRDA